MNKKRFTDYGEYWHVAKKSKCSGKLKASHQRSYTKTEANRLLKILSKDYFGNKDELIIEWDDEGPMSWGGLKEHRGRERPYVNLGTISSKKAQANDMDIYGLREGIVLHEFAHAINGSKNDNYGHGKQFVKILDELLRRYHK